MTVLVQLHGGLGNQMFQAAAGLALAARLDATLRFDLSRFRAKGPRAYALAPFAFDAALEHPSRTPVARLRRAILKRLDPVRAECPAGWQGRFYREPHFHFDPAFATLSGDVMIAGYFQSPRYFTGAEERIAEAFAPGKLASEAALQLAEKLDGETSVAVHLRRGDYAADFKAAAIHGVLDWGYYDRAVAHIRQQHPETRLFVFSDNAKAAAEGAARWLDAEPMAGTHAGDDLFLMSRARHHIIANSSFSWWSCWLDRREGGLRIAPAQWFAPGNVQETHDLYPSGWLRL
jgi:Glycosyl transferase family 11